MITKQRIYFLKPFEHVRFIGQVIFFFFFVDYIFGCIYLNWVGVIRTWLGFGLGDFGTKGLGPEISQFKIAKQCLYFRSLT